jgi:hypothetical protein
LETRGHIAKDPINYPIVAQTQRIFHLIVCGGKQSASVYNPSFVSSSKNDFLGELLIQKFHRQKEKENFSVENIVDKSPNIMRKAFLHAPKKASREHISLIS